MATSEDGHSSDPVRVYLREMGAIPLLTKKREVVLARRMERGQLRMRKAISRSPLIQEMVLEQARRIHNGVEKVDSLVPRGVDPEEAARRRAKAHHQFQDLLTLEQRRSKLMRALERTPPDKRKLRRRRQWKLMRTNALISQAIRGIPFTDNVWRRYSHELERAAESDSGANHSDLRHTLKRIRVGRQEAELAKCDLVEANLRLV
ncbi:MAG: RNA polymerase sigma factor RpoD, partial [bacterium]|nr:RNA polymerase sigma factor RpoD [bacterium]